MNICEMCDTGGGSKNLLHHFRDTTKHTKKDKIMRSGRQQTNHTGLLNASGSTCRLTSKS